MQEHRFGRLAKGISLLGFSVGLSLMPSVAAASCVTKWDTCRQDADRAFMNNRASVLGYAALLTGCDVGYGVCSLGKTKEDGK